MVIVDANVLIYAFWQQFSKHDSARTWLVRSLGGPERIGFPAVSILAYLRVTTGGKVVTPAPSMETACADIDACLDNPVATYLGGGARTWPHVRKQLVDYRVRGDLTTEAYLSAVALEHDATIVTFDRDFARFANVKVTYLG